MRKILYAFLGVFILFVTPQVFAVGEFVADYDVQYAISPAGPTIVTQNITLTNKSTNLYPQKYSITLDTTKIKNVIAYDSREIVKTEITQNEGKTHILLAFNDKVVGVGKQLKFTLRFENGDIAQKDGSIWEVNIPGIAQDSDIGTYSVSLAVPDSFGPNAYMTPLPALGNKWTREQMINGGISAAYGVSQSIDAALTYFIENPNISSAETEIALPPDTAYQTVAIKSLDPKPKTVIRDEDGNWLAKYQLAPGAKQTVEAKLHIDIQLKPKVGYEENIQDISVYLEPQKYWETQKTEIKDLAKKYTTPRQIYNYVVSALVYDYSRINETPIRKGAAMALSTPKNSVCMEFTDLFIAIARAAGIPSREAVGYANTNNSKLRPLSLVADVLHAWPEYFDSEKNLWTPVDPTWGNTTGGVNYFDKMDFNHIVFAYHGKTSDYPYPAGFYRKNGKVTKDVTIGFSTVPFTFPSPSYETTITFPKKVTAGLATAGQVTVQNTSGVTIPELALVVQSYPLDVGITKTEKRIPPYAAITTPIGFTIENYFTTGNGRIVATANGKTTQYYFDIQPITHYFFIPLISFGGIILILVILLAIRLWKQKKK